MLFNSVPFLFFFTIVTILYFSIPYGFRWILLLFASYMFYTGFRPEYLLLIILLTFGSYFSALQMGKEAIPSKRKKILLFCLAFHLGILFIFKYYNFFNSSLRGLFGHFDLLYGLPSLPFLLPVGLSFFTFKSLSYAIDVYRREQVPEQHLGRLGLYIAFFPQLLAGPIERAKRLLPQFYERHDFDYQRVSDGLKLMLWGLFQKVVIADNLAPLVDAVYNHPTHFQGASLMLATLFFTFQIYCDFAGYSDIAIGAAQVLGFRTMDNFNRPYFSKSIQEFWRRWHISLSTWFRDYLYFPLGGNRVSVPRWYLNLFVVLLICGLWHGANWTFLIWGGIHGFFLVFAAFTQGVRNRVHQAMGLNRVPKLQKTLKGLITFFLVCLAWIFFRANNISDGLYIVSHLWTGWGGFSAGALVPFEGVLKFNLVIGVVSTGILLIIHFLQGEDYFSHWLSQKRMVWRWSVYYSMILAILLFGPSQSKEFIYFQF
jgi:D-alanyl-lipoteichoic acid acyltransferase DltB (MBOAT superfamily)